MPALKIKTVLEHTTIRKRREALKTMPGELQGAFKATIDRIKRQPGAKSKQGMNVQQWVLLAKRLLTVEELRHPLAVNADNTELDYDSFISKESILQCCLGLVIVDEGTSTFRFVHKSLQKYLHSEYKNGSLFKSGNTDIASTCLTYMGFHTPQNQEPFEISTFLIPERPLLPYTKEERLIECGTQIIKAYPFLDYAICFWNHHAKETNSTIVVDLAIRVLQQNLDIRCISRNIWSWPILKETFLIILAG